MTVNIHDLPGSIEYTVEFDAVAASTASMTKGWHAPYTCRVKSVKLLFGANVTGQNSNTFHINLIDNDKSTELANKDFIAGTNATQGTEITLYSTDKNLASGENLYIQRQLVGAAGLATPPLTVIFAVEGR